MTQTKASKSEKTLTETELELMTIIWKLEQATVNDVLAALPGGRKLAYTSVSTILRILEQKKILGSRKEGRGHVYTPKLSKPEYEAATVRKLVSKVFDGAPVAMVRQLLDTSGISQEELKELRKLLDERLG